MEGSAQLAPPVARAAVSLAAVGSKLTATPPVHTQSEEA
jgi:hypothetical protein